MKRKTPRLYNYNLSHNNNTTLQMGKLIPIGLIPTLPGDIFKLSTSSLIRFSPMLKPVMHPIKAEIRWFYVPDRIVWDDCEDFHTGGDKGLETPEVPKISFSSVKSRSLADYYGIPVGDYTTPLEVSAIPFRGYNMIYNHFFRDQDLVDEIAFSTASGKDTTTPTEIRRVAWQKDYFTVARPWAQKGPSVSLNIGDISLNGELTGLAHSHNISDFRCNYAYNSEPVNYSGNNSGGLLKSSIYPLTGYSTTSLSGDFPISVTGKAGAVSITDLRFAFQMQSFLEELSRTGNRYDDVLRSQFGIRIRNEYIQEPVYIGGSKETLQISEVIQMSEGTNPLGSLGGHGIGAVGSKRHTYKCMEWGYLHAFLYIRPESVYMQALPRHWTYDIREDYYNPFFALIGQQQIKNQEVNVFHTDREGMFGFADRYDEYRDVPSVVTGEFRTTEKDWHLARELPNDVALNESFITCTPSFRIFAEQSGDYDHFQAMTYNKIQALRPVIRNPQPRLGM